MSNPTSPTPGDPTTPPQEAEADLDENDSYIWLPPKQPAWAFALNFFFPGAGLIYLRKPLAGVANFVVVVAVFVAFYFAVDRERFERFSGSIGLAVFVLSGMLALWMAKSQLQESNEG
jgi:hypothetical protein